MILDFSSLVYDIFTSLVFASWFSYALENWVVRIFLRRLFGFEVLLTP